MRTLENTAAKGKACILLPLLIFLLTTSSSSAGRFASSGPVVTLTLKDPEEQSYVSPVQEDGDTTESLQNPWFNFGNLRPNIMWSLQSKGKPLPNWVPNWHSLRTTVGYRYESLKRIPSFIEGDLKFSSESTGIDLRLQPAHEFGSQQSTVSIQASRGASAYLMAKFATKRDRLLQMVKGCYQKSLPYASVGAVRVTPSVDLARGQASCLLEATTGTQRTKAVLNLEYANPTLTVIHALNARYVNHNIVFIFCIKVLPIAIQVWIDSIFSNSDTSVECTVSSFALFKSRRSNFKSYHCNHKTLLMYFLTCQL
jgi:hypothetical protein